MDTWKIEYPSFYINGKIQEKEVIAVNAGNRTDEIIVTFGKGQEEGKKLFKLSCYDTPIRNEHHKSRTNFIKWFTKEKTQATDQYSFDEDDSGQMQESEGERNASSTHMQKTQATDQYSYDEDDSGQMQESEGERNASSTHMQDDTGFTGKKSSSLISEVDKKLIGASIPVSISNLMPPSKSRMVRPLHEEHVKELMDTFMTGYTQFNPIVGVIFEENVNLTLLQQENSCRVEVIGGNHTREALSRLQNMKEKLMQIRLYTNLTDKECLQLGVFHNDIHENSRKNTFIEKCMLARRLFNEIQGKEEISTRKKMSLFRSEIADIFRVNKQAVVNSYRVLIHISSLPSNVWEAMLEVFEAWGKCLIHKQPSKEMFQTHFLRLSHIQDQSEKRHILLQLARREIDFCTFQQACSHGLSNGKPEVKRKQDMKKRQGTLPCDDKEKQYQGSNAVPEEDKIFEMQEKIKQLEEDAVNLHRNLELEKRKIKKMKEDALTKDEQVRKLKKDLDLQKQMVQKMSKSALIKDEQIKGLEIKCSKQENTIKKYDERILVAEAATARARQLLCEQKIQLSKEQKCLKRKGEQIEKQSLQQECTEEERPANTEKVCKKRRSEKKGEENNDDTPSSSCITCAVVEYNGGLIFLGKL